MIDNKKLQEYNGGASNSSIWFIIGGAITFLIGFIDGIVRPLKCN